LAGLGGTAGRGRTAWLSQIRRSQERFDEESGLQACYGKSLGNGAFPIRCDEYLPPGSSAVAAVVDDQYADKVENALVKSDKRINKAMTRTTTPSCRRRSRVLGPGIGRDHVIDRSREPDPRRSGGS
jgi:hypothetical protein